MKSDVVEQVGEALGPLQKAHKSLWPTGWIGALVGVILFLIGIAFDLANSPSFPDINGLESCGNELDPNAACMQALVTYVGKAQALRALPWLEFFGTAFESLGLTLIAAAVVAATVQRQSQEEHFRQMDGRISSMAQNMMIGMFNRDHPPEVADALKKLIWDRSLVRSELKLTYVLRPFSPEDPNGRLKGKRYIEVAVMINTTMRNVSTVNGNAGQVDVPLMLTVPNPMINELKSAVKLDSYTYNGIAVADDLIEAANKDLQTQLQSDDVVDGIIKLGLRTLASSDTATVAAAYTMVKELEDNEVFKTLQITEAMTASVIDDTGFDLVVRAKALSHGSLIRQAGAKGVMQWHMSDLAIPEQGIMIWWKEVPREVAPAGESSHDVAGFDLTAPTTNGA